MARLRREGWEASACPTGGEVGRAADGESPGLEECRCCSGLRVGGGVLNGLAAVGNGWVLDMGRIGRDRRLGGGL